MRNTSQLRSTQKAPSATGHNISHTEYGSSTARSESESESLPPSSLFAASPGKAAPSPPASGAGAGAGATAALPIRFGLIRRLCVSDGSTPEPLVAPAGLPLLPTAADALLPACAPWVGDSRAALSTGVIAAGTAELLPRVADDSSSARHALGNSVWPARTGRGGIGSSCVERVELDSSAEAAPGTARTKMNRKLTTNLTFAHFLFTHTQPHIQPDPHAATHTQPHTRTRTHTQAHIHTHMHTQSHTHKIHIICLPFCRGQAGREHRHEHLCHRSTHEVLDGRRFCRGQPHGRHSQLQPIALATLNARSRPTNNSSARPHLHPAPQGGAIAAPPRRPCTSAAAV